MDQHFHLGSECSICALCTNQLIFTKGYQPEKKAENPEKIQSYYFLN